MAAGLEIHDAASTGDFDSLEEYLRSGKFDVNLKDAEWGNRTALHWACAKGFVECIRLLMDYGAIGTARSDSGWTPAHFAAETGKITALRALNNANIPVGLADKYGDTPKRIAEIYGHTECVKFLEQCILDEAAGIKRPDLPPRVMSVLRRRSQRSSVTSSRSWSPSLTETSFTSQSIASAEEEQKSKGIDNSIECPPDVDRET